MNPGFVHKYLARSGATALVVAFAAFAAACDDDDDDGDPTPAPSAMIAALANTPTVAPTVDPSITPGPAATIELAAEPQSLTCDGENASTVMARVLDEAGVPVADGTVVNFIVVALGTVDPVNATTTAGLATTAMTALGEDAGVVVNVESGDAAGSMRIDCL